MNRAAALAVVLLLGLAVPTGTGQVPAADVVATELRVLGEPGWIDGEAVDDDLRLEVDVRNNGNRDSSAYVIRYAWVGPSGTVGHLNGDEENSFTTGPPVRAGGTDQRRADWTLQPGQAGDGAVRVTISHDGRTTTKDFPVFVTDRRVSVSLEGGELQVRPDETRFLRLVARNDGNVDETVRLLLPDAGEGANKRLELEWSAPLLTVPAGSDGDSVLFVKYPFVGDTTPFTTTLTIHAVTEFGDPEHPIVLRTPTIRPGSGGFGDGYAFSLARAVDAIVYAAPGEAREVELTLRNDATGPDRADTYRVTLDATGGWTATTPDDRLALQTGATDTFRVRLVAPAQGAPGAPGTLDVQVVSDHDNPVEPAFPARLQVPLRLSGPAVVVPDLQLKPATLYAGDAPEARVVLRNDGDQTAPAGTLRLRLTLDGDVVETDQQVAALDAGRSLTRKVSLAAPADGGAATLEAEWLAPAGSGLLDGVAKLAVFVHEPDFQLTPADSIAGVPGSDVRYAAAPHAFTVRNTGNAPETIVLAATAEEGAVRLLGDATLRLEPGDVRTVPLVQSLPVPTGDLLPRRVTVTAHVEGRPDQTWSASTGTGIADDQGPTLRADAPPTEWLLTAAMPLRATASDETAVASVTLRVTAPDGTQSLVELNATDDDWDGEHRFAAAGNHTLLLTATDAAGNEATRGPHTVQVGAIPPPALDPVELPGGAAAWGSSFPVTVRDSRAVESVVVTVGDGGASRSFPVANGRAMVRLSEFPALQPGNVTLLVQAANVAGASASMSLDLVLLEPEPAQGRDQSVGRFTPGPSVLVLVASLSVALAVRRRLHG